MLGTLGDRIKHMFVSDHLSLKKGAEFRFERPGGGYGLLTTSDFERIANTISYEYGTHLYVDSVNGAAGWPGTRDKPMTAIDTAINACVTTGYTTIHCMPGHTEAITAASAIDLDVNNVRLMGHGVGSKQATVTFGNAAATIEINADNVQVLGMHFQATVTAVAIGIDVKDGADDYMIAGNRFMAETLGTDEFEDAIFVTTADRGIIAGNYFDMDEGGAASAIHLVDACLGVEIFKNIIQGDYSVACIEGVTAAGEMYQIYNNRLINGVHSGLNTLACINLYTGTTGFIEDNKLFCNVATPDLSVVADGCFISHDNIYCESAAGASEYLYIPRSPDSTYNFIGVDDSNNVASTANVAANEDGSVLERLEQVQEAVNIGSGTSLGANKSLVDALGTNGITLVDDAASIVGILGVDDANNAFASTNVVADRDGSILERLEFITNNMQKGFSVAAVDLSAVSPRTLFTITGGPIMIWFLALKVTVAASANAALLNFQSTPTVGSVTPISKVATAPDLQSAVAGDWFAVAGGSAEVAIKYATGTTLPDLQSGVSGGIIVDAGTIELVMSTNDLTTGTGIVYMVYTPLAEGVTVA